MTGIFPEKEAEKTAGTSERPDLEQYDFGTDAGPLGVVVQKDSTISYPQPTADPLDPLNWSRLKKHTILGIVMYL